MTAPFPTDTRSPQSTVRPSLPTDFRPLPPSRRDTVDLPIPLRLHHGGRLAVPRVAYELTGPPGAPGVIVAGGISAGRHVTAGTADPDPGWWSDFAGPGKAVDSDRFRILSFDFLGGNGESSGPRSADWPPGVSVSTRDQAALVAALLDHLGLPDVHAFVGSSYGGMVALALAAEFPERVGKIVAVGAAERPHPRSTAWRALQRRIVRLGRETQSTAEAMALARGLAMVTYRSAAEFESRFAGPPKPSDRGFRFPVEEYLDARGADFAASFHPEAFLALSESIDLHRVDPTSVTTPTTLVAVRSDELVPVEDLRRLASRIAGPCTLAELDSPYGHDAFLKETQTLGDILRRTLAEEPVHV